VFQDNVESPPDFADPDRFDFSLSSRSALRDAAAPLTVTRSAGEGRRVPVEDALYFYDGYGIVGERGDLIAIGSPDNRARVVQADQKKHVLHLDRDLKWDANAPVSFPWAGPGPDMGVFEEGDDVRPSVQVLASRVFLKPGERVTFEAKTRGLKPPLRYQWQLGDGARAQGERVTHAYADARDYGVRVRVTDADGQSYMGVGYVTAEPPQSEDVLIHTTFDRDDPDWWIHWQFYRGRRGTGYATYERILDEETGKGFHRIATRDNTGPLPAFLHPRNWDIDKYPKVRMRYRIRPGAPIAIFVRPFPSAHFVTQDNDFRQDTRRYYVAGTKAEPRGDQILIDDGEWHEITFDVRGIRKEFPEVRMLQALNMGDLEVDGGAKVGPKDEFWLDEIYIGK